MSVIVIGNFDGVHIGHKAVIERAAALASERRAALYILTFDVHPRTFFDPAHPVRKILCDADKKALLCGTEGAHVVFQTFDASFAATEAADYLSSLKRVYDCDTLVCGENFRLGKGAECGGDALIRLGASLGIGVLTVPTTRLGDGTPVSSTRVRDLIASGDVMRASEMLGRLYALTGTVVGGRHIGTSLALPTANLTFDGSVLLPGRGVYATLARADGTVWKAVTNVGTAPTVSDTGKTVVETHLLGRLDGTEGGFSSDLYGKSLKIGFAARLRDEKRFASLAALQTAIRDDIRQSDEIFAVYLRKKCGF